MRLNRVRGLTVVVMILSVKQCVLLNDGCLTIVWELFKAFFQEYLYNSLFEEGLNSFVKDGYNTPFEIIDIKE